MGQPDNPFNRGYFPDEILTNEDGLFAAGGSLDVPVLLEAYSKGIFPWYSDGSPILWWSPDPRMILVPEELKVSKSLGRTIRNTRLDIRMDTVFKEVIRHCSEVPRPGQEGTWITVEMIDAYIRLHAEGYAHSVEVFREDRLVGGLYGVSLGRVFFGESMFYLERDASKLALYYLVQFALKYGIELIDVQQSTAHMRSLGARELKRDEFLGLLSASLSGQSIRGPWSLPS